MGGCAESVGLVGAFLKSTDGSKKRNLVRMGRDQSVVPVIDERKAKPVARAQNQIAARIHPPGAVIRAVENEIAQLAELERPVAGNTAMEIIAVGQDLRPIVLGETVGQNLRLLRPGLTGGYRDQERRQKQSTQKNPAKSISPFPISGPKYAWCHSLGFPSRVETWRQESGKTCLVHLMSIFGRTLSQPPKFVRRNVRRESINAAGAWQVCDSCIRHRRIDFCFDIGAGREGNGKRISRV
jgi:hypothetical protein